MQEKKRFYKSDKITISFEAGKCIHAAECANGLPEVFNPKERPWVNPDGAEADKIKEVIDRCPSGALKYESSDDPRPETAATQKTQVTVVPNGPLFIKGEVELYSGDGNLISKEDRTSLCRCGASSNKPFCDGSHKSIKFDG
jgi:uncharacterized Fe-S cluster protein YjdI